LLLWELELISLKNCLQLLSQPLRVPAEQPLKMKHLILTTIAAVVLVGHSSFPDILLKL